MRKNLCIVLIIIICIINSIVYAENTTDLQSQRNELQNNIEEETNKLNQIQEDISENLKQVQKLDEKIASAESKLEDLENQVNELKKSIGQVESQLNEATKSYQKQKEVFQKRIVSIYEAGETQYLDVILNSKSLSDFLSSYYVISEIAEYDEQLLSYMKEKKVEITQTKKKLDNEKKELALKLENQIKESKTLENTKVYRENYISRLSEEEKQIQSKIDEYYAQFNDINRQILQLAQGNINSEYIGGQLAWPVPGYSKITSKYGMRTHPITGVYSLHTGIDISAPIGVDFIAVNDGIVTKAEYNVAYGKMVIVDHGGGISTLYAHGSETLVQVGQTVKRGEAILKVGSTGYSTGPHAHFEVRIKGITTDPLPYITTGLIPGQ